MAGTVKFQITVTTKNAVVLPELQARLKDLSPAFEAIIPEWAKLNADKFDAGKGLEGSGAKVDALVFWEALKPATSKSKRRRARGNALMVDSGDLRRALTTPDLVFQRVEAQDAVFGTPLNLEEADKAKFNWAKRQVVFFSTADKNVIRRVVQDYLSYGPGFQEIRFAKGLAATRLRKEVADMDAAFDNTLGD